MSGQRLIARRRGGPKLGPAVGIAEFMTDKFPGIQGEASGEAEAIVNRETGSQQIGAVSEDVVLHDRPAKIQGDFGDLRRTSHVKSTE